MNSSDKYLEEISPELDYNPDTGDFYWNTPKKGRNRHKPVGSLYTNGYLYVTVRGHNVSLHRLAFYKQHGYAPITVDHKNKVRTDNRTNNLRAASYAQNNANTVKKSKLGIPNVFFVHGSYRVSFVQNGKSVFLARFKDLELATLVANEVRDKLYGEFANHGHEQETTYPRA